MGKFLRKLAGIFTGDKGHGEDTKWDVNPFYAETFQQSGYDREIDEGMSSGMRRLVTIDVTELDNKEIEQILDIVSDEARDYSLCKQVQVAGFYAEGSDGGEKKYVAVSGESHYYYQGSTASMYKDHVNEKLFEFNENHEHHVAYQNGFVPIPNAQSYTPLDLGPYGTTGGPPSHLDQGDIDAAKELHDQVQEERDGEYGA